MEYFHARTPRRLCQACFSFSAFRKSASSHTGSIANDRSFCCDCCLLATGKACLCSGFEFCQRILSSEYSTPALANAMQLNAGMRHASPLGPPSLSHYARLQTDFLLECNLDTLTNVRECIYCRYAKLLNITWMNVFGGTLSKWSNWWGATGSSDVQCEVELTRMKQWTRARWARRWLAGVVAQRVAGMSSRTANITKPK
jgi:hypothetical protein